MQQNEPKEKEFNVAEMWYENHKTLLLVLVVLSAALSMPYFRILNDNLMEIHPALVSIIAGIIIILASYLPLRYVSEKFAFSNAVLLGLIVAKFSVYGAPCNFPAPLLIAFFFFMFFFGYEEREHLWPANKTCKAIDTNKYQ